MCPPVYQHKSGSTPALDEATYLSGPDEAVSTPRPNRAGPGSRYRRGQHGVPAGGAARQLVAALRLSGRPAATARSECSLGVDSGSRHRRSSRWLADSEANADPGVCWLESSSSGMSIDIRTRPSVRIRLSIVVKPCGRPSPDVRRRRPHDHGIPRPRYFGDGVRGGVVQPHRASVAWMVASLHRTSDGATKTHLFACPFNPANHDLARRLSGPRSASPLPRRQRELHQDVRREGR